MKFLLRCSAVAFVACAGGPVKEHTLNARGNPVSTQSRGDRLLVDASKALHFVEAALRDYGASTDAKKLSHTAAPNGGKGVVLESDADGRAAQLRSLRARLDRLERRYAAKEASAAEADAARLQAVRKTIDSAGKRVDELMANTGKLDSPPSPPANTGNTGIDIDSTIVPYPGAVEQFGSEDAAQNLTIGSVKESNGMIDSIERAQAVESKRAVHRALTHLRGAAITAYDGIAHGHLANVDQYARDHHWRDEHTIHHLAEEEADVGRWAFPVATKETVDTPSISSAPAEGQASKAAAKSALKSAVDAPSISSAPAEEQASKAAVGNPSSSSAPAEQQEVAVDTPPLSSAPAPAEEQALEAPAAAPPATPAATAAAAAPAPAVPASIAP